MNTQYPVPGKLRSLLSLYHRWSPLFTQIPSVILSLLWVLLDFANSYSCWWRLDNGFVFFSLTRLWTIHKKKFIKSRFLFFFWAIFLQNTSTGRNMHHPFLDSCLNFSDWRILTILFPLLLSLFIITLFISIFFTPFSILPNNPRSARKCKGHWQV